MKSTVPEAIEHFRIIDNPLAGEEGDIEGTYVIPYREGIGIQCQVSVLHGHDRVSVMTGEDRSGDARKHLRKGLSVREPTLKELRFIRRVFWDNDEPNIFLQVSSDPKQNSKSAMLFCSQEVDTPSFG